MQILVTLFIGFVSLVSSAQSGPSAAYSACESWPTAVPYSLSAVGRLQINPGERAFDGSELKSMDAREASTFVLPRSGDKASLTVFRRDGKPSSSLFVRTDRNSGDIASIESRYQGSENNCEISRATYWKEGSGEGTNVAYVVYDRELCAKLAPIIANYPGRLAECTESLTQLAHTMSDHAKANYTSVEVTTQNGLKRLKGEVGILDTLGEVRKVNTNRFLDVIEKITECNESISNPLATAARMRNSSLPFGRPAVAVGTRQPAVRLNAPTTGIDDPSRKSGGRRR